MIITLFSGFSESYRISSCKCCDLLDLNEGSVKTRYSLVLEVKLKWHSLTLGIIRFLQVLHKMRLNSCWILTSSVNIILFEYTKSHTDCFLVLVNSWYSSRSQIVSDFKNSIQRHYGFSFHLHIFILISVGKIQSCQILPVGNGLSDIADTIWWNRLLGGLKTDGTTFGWTPGDQRADIQLAPDSEQSTQGSVLGSMLLDIFISRLVKTQSVPSPNVLMALNYGEQLTWRMGGP